MKFPVTMGEPVEFKLAAGGVNSVKAPKEVFSMEQVRLPQRAFILHHAAVYLLMEIKKGTTTIGHKMKVDLDLIRLYNQSEPDITQMSRDYYLFGLASNSLADEFYTYDWCGNDVKFHAAPIVKALAALELVLPDAESIVLPKGVFAQHFMEIYYTEK